ncbi:MAG TPA: hypothetical protein VGO27_00705, partial [Candidatus Acidoferrum sp.]|nr:hypothetical protein [Candidatus Acidoferrum sp.]
MTDKRHRTSKPRPPDALKGGLAETSHSPSFGSALGRAFRGTIIRSILATVLFVAVFLITTKAWKLNIYSPLTYWGDALEMASYMGRDYVFNDLRERFFAPFGVDHATSLRYVVNFLLQPNSTLFLLAYSVTRDTVAALNLYYLSTFPLAFLSAYWVYGRLKLADPFRVGSATLYALMPFHFQSGVVHLMESSYFLVPILAYALVLVFRARPYFHAYSDGAWRWSWRDKQDWFWLGLMVFLSSLNEYHQLFFMMLLPVAAVIASVQHRNHRILGGAAVLLTAAGLSTIAKMILNRLLSEPGLELSIIGTPISGYGEAEIYGLKMIQIILPASGHHLEYFRLIRRTYEAAHVVNENGAVALGLFGAVGFIYLMMRGVYSIARRTLKVGILDVAALLAFACVAIATIGGVASLVATIGDLLFGPQSILTQIRCYNRIIVFIGFFSYYAASVLLAGVVFRIIAYLRIRRNANLLASLVSLPLFGVALWDQVPFKIANSPGESARYASDREFFAEVERQLAPRALVFQCPFNIHHADVNQSGNSPYNYADGIRPYLNSRTLRFTYGSDDGSPQLGWLEKTSQLPTERMVERLCEFGFSGIVVH